MCNTCPGDGWLFRIINRLRPAPTRPPTWHTTRTLNTHPGRGRHRADTGGIIVTHTYSDGRQLRFRRRP